VIELALHVEELENIQHRVNMDVVRFVVASVQSLDLEKRLSPRRNPEVGWFYVFLPAFVTYIMFLTKFLNARPEVGTIEVSEGKMKITAQQRGLFGLCAVRCALCQAQFCVSACVF
jgi:hypothetical protein